MSSPVDDGHKVDDDKATPQQQLSHGQGVDENGEDERCGGGQFPVVVEEDKVTLLLHWCRLGRSGQGHHAGVGAGGELHADVSAS